MNKISLLDVTLRDGGYINNWEFCDEEILAIISQLQNANIDIIECGYLNARENSTSNKTIFNSIAKLEKLLSCVKEKKSDYILMINHGEFDVNNLPEKLSTQIDGIRLAFYKEDMKKALENAQKIKQKGYKLFIQPMIMSRYSVEEICMLTEQINKIKPHVFYFVDSFGIFSRKDFNQTIDILDKNLDKNTKLGIHLHNNLQLAFSNAIDVIEKKLNRQIIVDSSVCGMGRGAGNLCTELIIDYLNKNNSTNYEILPLLQIMDNSLSKYFFKKSWGCSPIYFITAKAECHPNYATYFFEKENLSIIDVEKVIKFLDKTKSHNFNEKYA
ncbi:MAG: aldolase catalytic domain-containing protein, partial [Candidatus Gastranaerophilales bacterium]|nr:aldolase catalytic domain-containing protein [Candidatus Gastranaerophilales bacterium]